MVVEQFKKLWLPSGVDFMTVPELSADHCKVPIVGTLPLLPRPPNLLQPIPIADRKRESARKPTA